MSRINLDARERSVLRFFTDAAKVDPDGAYSAYHPDVVKASDFSAWGLTLGLLRQLRRRGLLDGNGARSKWDATFWISDKGRKALDNQ